MIFNRRVITKFLDLVNLKNHNDNFTEIHTDLTDHEFRITGAQSDITTHKASTAAHPAEHVTYEGEVIGAENIKEGLDIIKTELDQAIISGDSGPEAAASRYNPFTGVTFATLPDRLNEEWEQTATQLAEITALHARNWANYTRKYMTDQSLVVCGRGDSLTFGVGNSDISYLVYLKEYLDAYYGGTSSPTISTVMQAIGGSTTTDSLTRWTENPNADISFIMLGTNDSFPVSGSPRVPIETYTENLRKIVKQQILWGSAVVLLVQPRQYAQSNFDRESYRRACIAVGRELSVPTIDTTSFFLGYAAEKIYSVEDQVHFNEFGYRLIASRLYAVMSGGNTERPQIMNDNSAIFCNSQAESLSTKGITGVETTGDVGLSMNMNGSNGIYLPLANVSSVTYSVYFEDTDMIVIPSLGVGSGGTPQILIDFGLEQPATFIPSAINDAAVVRQMNSLAKPAATYNYASSTFSPVLKTLSDTAIGVSLPHIAQPGWHTITIRNTTSGLVNVYNLRFFKIKSLKVNINALQKTSGKLAENIPMANNLGINIDDSGGTARTVFQATSSNVFNVGNAAFEMNLRGSIMRASGTFKLMNTTTAGRPTAGLEAGVTMWDITLNKPIYWTGSAWVDSAGAAV